MKNWAHCMICNLDYDPEQTGIFDQPVFGEVHLVYCEHCARDGDPVAFLEAAVNALILAMRAVEAEIKELHHALGKAART